MAPPKRKQISCPSCQHQQMEYVEANSTFCHACGTRISLLEPRAKTRNKRSVARRLPPKRKKLACVHCDHPLQIPETSDSWQCPVCSGYLDLKDHELNTSAGRSILTYGDITVKSRGRFGGTRIAGKNIFMNGGAVAGQIAAREKLVITRPSKIEGDATVDQLCVESEGGFENRKSLHCRVAEIKGRVRLRELIASESLKIESGGRLQVDRLVAPCIEVEEGGSLIATHARVYTEPKSDPEPKPNLPTQERNESAASAVGD